MDIEASRLQCVDFEMGTRLRFENPSDAIFANLFLQEGGISWSSCDTLLSAIRNPSFNARQVTFKDSSDLAARIAHIRERDLMRHRKAEQILGLPEIVLEGVIDALSDELGHNTDLLLNESHGHIPYNMHVDTFPGMLQSWKATLVSCALVHSSWLAPARRALGYSHCSGTEMIHRSVKSPWIGRWTKDLYIRIHTESVSSSSTTTTPLLRPLFARLPHLQRLQLTSYVGGFGAPSVYPDMMSSFLENLHLLPCLNELTFTVSDVLTSFGLTTSLIQTLTKIPLPNLKVIRLLEVPFRDFETLNLPHQFSPILSAFPSLQTIHFDIGAKVSVSYWQELYGILWNKITDTVPDSSGQANFLPNYVRACITNFPGSDDSPNWRRWRSSLSTVQRLCCQCYHTPAHPEISVAREVQDVFALCSSLRSLSFLMGTPETDAIATMLHIPPTVEELEFTFPILFGSLFEPTADHPSAYIEEWDADFAKVLRAETSPRLHTFRAHFSQRTVNENVINMHSDTYGKLFRKLHTEDEEHHTMDSSFVLGPLLPSCQKVCEERGIQFSVDALILF